MDLFSSRTQDDVTLTIRVDPGRMKFCPTLDGLLDAVIYPPELKLAGCRAVVVASLAEEQADSEIIKKYDAATSLSDSAEKTR